MNAANQKSDDVIFTQESETSQTSYGVDNSEQQPSHDQDDDEQAHENVEIDKLTAMKAILQGLSQIYRQWNEDGERVSIMARQFEELQDPYAVEEEIVPDLELLMIPDNMMPGAGESRLDEMHGPDSFLVPQSTVASSDALAGQNDPLRDLGPVPDTPVALSFTASGHYPDLFALNLSGGGVNPSDFPFDMEPDDLQAATDEETERAGWSGHSHVGLPYRMEFHAVDDNDDGDYTTYDSELDEEHSTMSSQQYA